MRLLLLAALALAVSPVHAQDSASHRGGICTLYAVEGTAVSGPPLDPEALAATARQRADASGEGTIVETKGARATIVVRYNRGFTAEAQAAFQSAVDIWAAHLTSSVPIRVEANYGPLATNVLGSAGPRITANFTSDPRVRRDTWYPFGLADAIVGRDLFPPVSDDPNTSQDETDYRADLVATFSSAFPNFYFGLDGNPPPGDFDFRTIVLHELGHGLGFVGTGDYDDGVVSSDNPRECDGVEGHGCWGFETTSLPPRTYPIIFDYGVEDRGGVAMLNTVVYPQNSVALGDLVTSNGTSPLPEEKELFMDGAAIRTVNADMRAPLYAPRPAEPGSSFSHWDEFVYASGESNALMTPRIARGEAYTDPGPLTCALFLDMGWSLGPGCESLFPTPGEAGPLATGTALVRTGANPFAERTSFRLVLEQESAVRATLVDVLGRTVRTLYAGPAGPRGVDLDVDGAALAPGLYVVRVEGGEAPLAVPVVRR